MLKVVSINNLSQTDYSDWVVGILIEILIRSIIHDTPKNDTLLEIFLFFLSSKVYKNPHFLFGYSQVKDIHFFVCILLYICSC